MLLQFNCVNCGYNTAATSSSPQLTHSRSRTFKVSLFVVDQHNGSNNNYQQQSYDTNNILVISFGPYFITANVFTTRERNCS